MVAKLGWFLLIAFSCLVVTAQETTSPVKEPPIDQRIEQLIKKLGSDSFQEREDATSDLAQIGGPARKALVEASQSPDLETSARAKRILALLPKFTHSVVDALGAPIPGAKVTIQFFQVMQPGQVQEVEVAHAIHSTADEEGGIHIPAGIDGSIRVLVTAEHPSYGRARNTPHPDRTITKIVMPLVAKESEAHARALFGQITAADGKVIENAVLQCDNIRTAGQGLINGKFPIGEALTNVDGFFTFYLPSDGEKKERGELIPPNSNFNIRVLAPHDDSQFPLGGSFTNGQLHVLRMTHVTRKFQFEFENSDRELIKDPKLLAQARIQFEQVNNNEVTRIPLSQFAALQGCKLTEGKYTAQIFDNGNTITYQPLQVTTTSPEVLRFRLPPDLVYRGRIVHGVTGKPISGAFLMGWNSTARNNLALLTPEEWNQMHELPANPPLESPELKHLKELYGVKSVVRTDSEGKFELRRRADQEMYGVMAFDEAMIPYKITLGALKPDEKHAIDLGELPLFPAAKLLVQPTLEGTRLSVSPFWEYDDKGQPEWFEKFRAYDKGSERQYEYIHWLTMNEMQVIYVPASIRLKVRFDSPYDDKWSPVNSDEVFQLKQNELHKRGEVRFVSALEAKVKVVDETGKPLEGYAVRKKLTQGDTWSISHNTDKDGLCSFFIPPKAQGQFRVTDLPGDAEVNKAANLSVDFTINETSPQDPFLIKLTPDQVKLFQDNKK